MPQLQCTGIRAIRGEFYFFARTNKFDSLYSKRLLQRLNLPEGTAIMVLMGRDTTEFRVLL